jgi:predicted glycoside hydrolase/deacetylase ChbG (UPF0249 family)
MNRSPSRRLAICADDFGMNDDVDGAILDLVVRHRVTTVSCLVGGDSWARQGPRLARQPLGIVETGLHFDLTWSPLGGLAPRPLPILIAGALARALSATLLRDQVGRQLDAFEAVMQRVPDHVDGHQHVHQLPMVRDALLEVLDRRYPGELPWIRSTLPSSVSAGKARLIDLLGGQACRRAAAARGRATSGRLLGVHDFHTDAAGYAALLDGWVADCRDGDVLMCHPGWSPGAHDDPLRVMRGIEWLALSGEGFGQTLSREQVMLSPWSRARPLHDENPGSPPVPAG